MQKPKFSGGGTRKRHMELISAYQKAFELWKGNRDIKVRDLHKQLKLEGFVVAPKTVSNWRIKFNHGVFPNEEENKKTSSPHIDFPLSSAEEIVNAYIAVLDKVRAENRTLKEEVASLLVENGSLKARCDLAESRIREDFQTKLARALAEPGD